MISVCTLYSRRGRRLDKDKDKELIFFLLFSFMGILVMVELAGVLGGSQLRHHQLWQLCLLHAHRLPVCHAGGLDRYPLLGKEKFFIYIFLPQGKVSLSHPEIFYFITQWSCSGLGSLCGRCRGFVPRDLCPMQKACALPKSRHQKCWP